MEKTKRIELCQQAKEKIKQAIALIEQATENFDVMKARVYRDLLQHLEDAGAKESDNSDKITIDQVISSIEYEYLELKRKFGVTDGQRRTIWD